MSVEEIKVKVRRFVDEPWNKGDFRIVEEFCDPAYTVSELHKSETGDRDYLIQAIKQYRTRPGSHNL